MHEPFKMQFFSVAFFFRNIINWLHSYYMFVYVYVQQIVLSTLNPKSSIYAYLCTLSFTPFTRFVFYSKPFNRNYISIRNKKKQQQQQQRK